jgi:hypothetical protein
MENWEKVERKINGQVWSRYFTMVGVWGLRLLCSEGTVFCTHSILLYLLYLAYCLFRSLPPYLTLTPGLLTATIKVCDIPNVKNEKN